ncbi:MAG: YjfB family protein [Roseburia sp.]|nr:YjfB family protein [Roseburia sp.]
MDIANVSSALNTVSSYNIGTSVSAVSLPEVASVAVLDMTMELNEQLNAQMIKMMEQSVTPHLGGNIDVRI